MNNEPEVDRLQGVALQQLIQRYIETQSEIDRLTGEKGKIETLRDTTTSTLAALKGQLADQAMFRGGTLNVKIKGKQQILYVGYRQGYSEPRVEIHTLEVAE